MTELLLTPVVAVGVGSHEADELEEGLGLDEYGGDKEEGEEAKEEEGEEAKEGEEG